MTAGGGDLTAQAMGTPEQQAKVRAMMEEGSGYGTAATNDTSSKAVIAMDNAKRRAERGADPAAGSDDDAGLQPDPAELRSGRLGDDHAGLVRIGRHFRLRWRRLFANPRAVGV